MHLRRLTIRDFRNLENVDVELPRGLTVLFGDNGQGKTSVLEAIYLLATLKSFRGARNPVLVRHDAEAAVIHGEVVASGLPRRCQLTVRAGGKRVRVDGKSPRQLPEYFRGIKAVAFVPEDLRLVAGAPELRRGFLDRAAFTLDPGYLELARRHREVLSQKNALLREAKHRGRRPQEDLLELWNEQIVELGSQVVQRRVDFLQGFAPRFREVHEGLTGAAKGHAEIRYRGPVPADTVHEGVEAIAEALRTRLAQVRDTEIRRGFATIGAQRDDWELRVGGEALRAFGSQGQVRSAALALRVAQMLLVQQRCGHCPIFLLDDHSSELDARRNRHLMHTLQDLDAQVLVTTTELGNLPAGQQWALQLRVEDGRVSEVESGAAES